MAEKFIYLAGPIAGCNYGEATEWRGYVKSRLAPNIIGISPMRDKSHLDNGGMISGDAKDYSDQLLSSQRAIVGRDKYDATHCDGILAYLPREMNERRPSIGTIIEIGAASWGKEIPVVLVTDDTYYANHPLMMDCCNWIVPNLDDAVTVVNSVFGAYKHTPWDEIIKSTKVA